LVAAYNVEQFEPGMTAERASFCMSGRRISSLSQSFDERYSLAIARAIFLPQRMEEIDGPLFLGCDTDAADDDAWPTADGASFNCRSDGPADARMREGFEALTPDWFARPGRGSEAAEQVLTRTHGYDGSVGSPEIVTGSGSLVVTPPLPRTPTNSLARTSRAPASQSDRERRAPSQRTRSQAGDRG
jgi:hypothetical protein